MGVVLVLLLVFVLPLGDGETATLRTGFPASAYTHLPYFAAIEKGFFKAEDIEMETVRMGSGSHTGKINRKTIEDTLSWQLKLGLLTQPLSPETILDESFTPR